MQQNEVRAVIKKTPGTAIASLICGISGIPLSFLCLGIIFAPAAIVLGHVARSSIIKHPDTLKGSRIAIAGLVLGYISISLTLFFTFIVSMEGFKRGYNEGFKESYSNVRQKVVNSTSSGSQDGSTGDPETENIKKCLMNLLLIDACKEQIQRDYGLSVGSIISADIWKRYEDKRPFLCPSGGAYTVGRIGEISSCSISEHKEWHQVTLDSAVEPEERQQKQ